MRFKDDSDRGVFRDLLKVVAGPDSDHDDLEYAIVEKSNELRYTLGPLYLPNTLDAHDEWATSEDLRKAVWDYVDNGDRTIRKQHGTEHIGKVREVMQWPTEIETEVTRADTGEVRKVKYPAGTVFLGVQWSKPAWELVKSRKISGYSLGGRAVRLQATDIEKQMQPETADRKSLIKQCLGVARKMYPEGVPKGLMTSIMKDPSAWIAAHKDDYK